MTTDLAVYLLRHCKPVRKHSLLDAAIRQYATEGPCKTIQEFELLSCDDLYAQRAENIVRHDTSRHLLRALLRAKGLSTDKGLMTRARAGAYKKRKGHHWATKYQEKTHGCDWRRSISLSLTLNKEQEVLMDEILATQTLFTREVRALADMVVKRILESAAQLEALDDHKDILGLVEGARLPRLVGQGVVRVLVIYKRRTSPFYDSHYRYVPKEIFDRWPRLKEMPPRAAQFASRFSHDLVDQSYVVTLLTFTMDHALANEQHSRKLPARVVRSVVLRTLALLYWVHFLHRRTGETMRHLLTADVSAVELTWQMARLIAVEYRHRRPMAKRRVDGRSIGFRDRVCFVYHRHVQLEMYPQIPPTWHATPKQLNEAICWWSQQDPSLYSNSDEILRVPVFRPPHEPTEQDIEALRGVCMNGRERLFFCLLHEVCIRAEAFTQATIDSVWDMTVNRPRPCYCFIEKNSDARRITPSAGLRAITTEYILQERQPTCGSDPLFTSQTLRCSGMSVTTGFARRLLGRLCMRAGVPPLHPHQFRTLLVNTAMERGCSLDNVARWLGHRNPRTTYQHYWTQPPNLDPLFDNQSNTGSSTIDDDTKRLCDALREKADEVAELKQLLSKHDNSYLHETK